MSGIIRIRCCHCQQLFTPDARNATRQRYCSKPSCRQASKADSQRRWLQKPENRDYFRGVKHVQRVQRWRASQRFSQRKAAPRSSKLDPFKTEIARLLDSHPFTAAQILMRIREQAMPAATAS